MVPIVYLLMQFLQDVNTISEADYLLIFYVYFSTIFRILSDPVSKTSSLFLKFLNFLYLYQKHVLVHLDKW